MVGGQAHSRLWSTAEYHRNYPRNISLSERFKPRRRKHGKAGTQTDRFMRSQFAIKIKTHCTALLFKTSTTFRFQSPSPMRVILSAPHFQATTVNADPSVKSESERQGCPSAVYRSLKTALIERRFQLRLNGARW